MNHNKAPRRAPATRRSFVGSAAATAAGLATWRVWADAATAHCSAGNVINVAIAA